uniref:Uncharacterized protein n=1 Tax=Zea mays TaxID=4577 RepID=A0A804P1T0_MAIZE
MEPSRSQKMAAADSPRRVRTEDSSCLRSTRALDALLPPSSSAGEGPRSPPSSSGTRNASTRGTASRMASYMSSTLKSFSAARFVSTTASVKVSMCSMAQCARSAKMSRPRHLCPPAKTRAHRSRSPGRSTSTVCWNAFIHVAISDSSASQGIFTTSSMLAFSYPRLCSDASSAFRRAIKNTCVHSVSYPAANMASTMARSRPTVSGGNGGEASAMRVGTTQRSSSAPCPNDGGRFKDLPVALPVSVAWGATLATRGSSSVPWNSSSTNVMARCSTPVMRCTPMVYVVAPPGALSAVSVDASAASRLIAARSGGASPASFGAHLSSVPSDCAISCSTALANLSSVTSETAGGASPSLGAARNASISADRAARSGSAASSGTASGPPAFSFCASLICSVSLIGPREKLRASFSSREVAVEKLLDLSGATGILSISCRGQAGRNE